MSDLALYRKYRSQSFDAVIGQPQIVATLKSAIINDRLSHAYLFTGPRGVGKTSVARLLARAANCTHDAANTRPCGECANCKVEIGSHLDLIEIDAASNRGIDDARALREKITSAPSMGRRKVYIIDEVHMLTTEAFNALLKTLEEPPVHAMFILATTEAHKLPETIVSRTQRFSFRPIDSAAITEHLKNIAQTEGIKITDEALAIIAASSRGGFRDAISLLDQVANSGGAELDAAAVHELLGQGDPAILKGIMKAVNNQDPTVVLRSLDEAWKVGIQPGQLARQLIDAWRVKLRESVGKPDSAATVQLAVAGIEALLPVLKTSWPELALEAALVRLASGDLATQPLVRPATQVTPTVKAAAPVSAEKATEAPTAASTPAGELPQGVPSGDLWLKALTQIKQRNNSLYALLRSSCTVRFEGTDVILGCRFTFHRDRLKETKNLQLIEQTLTRVYQQKLRIQPQMETQPTGNPTPASPNPDTELVSSALEILGGEVIYE